MSKFSLMILVALAVPACQTEQESHTPIDPIVYGGWWVNDWDFPAVGMLRGDNNLLCTATAITTRHVLTAAHCVVEENSGAWRNVFGFEQPYTGWHPIVWGAVHPTYNPWDPDASSLGHGADIAIVEVAGELTSPMGINRRVLEPGEGVTGVGYGHTEVGTVGIKAAYSNQIDKRLNEYAYEYDMDTDVNGKGKVLPGDSGGPIIAWSEPTLIAGVASATDSWGAVDQGSSDDSYVAASFPIADWVVQFVTCRFDGSC